MTSQIPSLILEDQFVKCKPVIYVSALTPASSTFVLSGECRINVTLTCDLPQPITCQRITLALTKDYEEIFGNSTPQSTDSSISMTSPFKQRHLKRGANSHKRIRPRTASETSTNDLEYLSAVTTGMKYQTVAPNVLKMSCRLDKDVNNTVISSSLICQSQIKRNDSSTYGNLREKEQELTNQSEAVRAENIVLQPGDNQLCLTGNVSETGDGGRGDGRGWRQGVEGGGGGRVWRQGVEWKKVMETELEGDGDRGSRQGWKGMETGDRGTWWRQGWNGMEIGDGGKEWRRGGGRGWRQGWKGVVGWD